jgi:hypothetical protein
MLPFAGGAAPHLGHCMTDAMPRVYAGAWLLLLLLMTQVLHSIRAGTLRCAQAVQWAPSGCPLTSTHPEHLAVRAKPTPYLPTTVKPNARQMPPPRGTQVPRPLHVQHTLSTCPSRTKQLACGHAAKATWKLPCAKLPFTHNHGQVTHYPLTHRS